MTTNAMATPAVVAVVAAIVLLLGLFNRPNYREIRLVIGHTGKCVLINMDCPFSDNGYKCSTIW